MAYSGGTILVTASDVADALDGVDQLVLDGLDVGLGCIGLIKLLYHLTEKSGPWLVVWAHDKWDRSAWMLMTPKTPLNVTMS